MSHRRYQSPQKGYSRRDRRQSAHDVEMEFDDDDSIALAEPMADALLPLMAVEPAPAAPAPVATTATVVNRGTAFEPPAEPTNARIRALDRLLAVIRKSR